MNPFDNKHFIGFVKSVNPEYIEVHIPASKLLSLYHYDGAKHHPGVVGAYVVIEGEEFGFLGKVLELFLSEKERLWLTEKTFEKENFHPVAKVEILISYNHYKPNEINRGLDTFPHIGAKVFTAKKEFLQKYLSDFGKQGENEPIVDIGVLTSDYETEISASLQSIFGRHCAIVGTTGGGKSYTVSYLLQKVMENKGKVILFDATGEYHNLDQKSNVKSISLGDTAYFHYKKLSIGDLFYLLRPSDKVQRPKLLEAIRSLKIVRMVGSDLKVSNTKGEVAVEDNLIKKAGKTKAVIDAYYYQNIKDIDQDNLDFEIKKLAQQLTEECIYDSDRTNPASYGGRLETDVSYCTSLMSRINNLIHAETFQNIFGFNIDEPQKEKDVVSQIEEFIKDDNLSVLRISLENVSFEFQVREILVNAIGKFLLNLARTKKFKENPLIVFVDEAHQFLNKTIQDDYASIQPLDAFESIAKECRKHGLFLCLATQMPRDIPMGVLSQMGTFIVHRLINRYDKETIENASSTANRSVLSFLPSLGRGEAILMGVDFPMPISIKIALPVIKPDSQTPSVIKLKT